MINVDLVKILKPHEIENLKQMIIIAQKEDNTLTPHRRRLFVDWMKTIKDEDNFFKTIMDPVHKILLDGYKKIILKIVDETKIDIPVLFGSLLGPVRDGKLIPYDDDLDVGIDINDYEKHKEKIKKIVEKNNWRIHPNKWFSDEHKNGHGELMLQLYPNFHIKYDFGEFYINYSPRIDIFPMAKFDEEKYDFFEELEYAQMHIYNYLTKGYKNYDNVIAKHIIDKCGKESFEKIKSYSQLEENTLDKSYEKVMELISKNSNSRSNNYIILHKNAIRTSIVRMEKPNIINISGIGFITQSNSIEQLERNYLNNWKEPTFTHTHTFSLVELGWKNENH